MIARQLFAFLVGISSLVGSASATEPTTDTQAEAKLPVMNEQPTESVARHRAGVAKEVPEESGIGTLAVKKQCLVKKLKYTNKGRYISRLKLRSWDRRGERLGYQYEKSFSEDITAGTSRTIDLANKDIVKPGWEVWLAITINWKTKDCQKDGTQLIYDPERGNTWKYWSEGSNVRGNRCQFGNNTCINP